MSKATLYTDGGSRGNPGRAGIGFIIVDQQGTVLAKGGWNLDYATNNIAEYSALVWGLKNARALKIDHLEVLLDSELVAKQINGLYKVKNVELRRLYDEARLLMTHFSSVSVAHVYREHNKDADRLANEAMDALTPVGTFVVSWEEAPLNLFDHVPENREQGVEIPCETVNNNMSKTNEKGFDTMQKSAPYEGPAKLSGETYENAGGHYELTVKDHFDAAHALPGYDGPCQYLHGHTWDVEVTVVGETLDSVGIVYDFNAIKADLHEILENFDHKYINDTPPFDVINPTAEHLARVLFYELEKKFPEGISLEEVSVWESPIARLTYRR